MGSLVLITTQGVFKWVTQPRFEIRKIGNDGNAVLINRSLRPILLGDSFCMETQARLLVPSPLMEKTKGDPLSRIIVERIRGQRILLLNGADLGHRVTFTYRPLWRRSGGKLRSKLGPQADTVGPFIWRQTPDPTQKGWKEHSVLVTN